MVNIYILFKCCSCDFPTISPKDAWRAKFAGFSEKNPDPADFETQIRFLRERMENDPGVKECIKRIKELDGNDAMVCLFSDAFMTKFFTFFIINIIGNVGYDLKYVFSEWYD